MVSLLPSGRKTNSLSLLITLFILYLSSCDVLSDLNKIEEPGLNLESPYITDVFDYCYGVGQHSEAHGSISALPSDSDKFIGTNSDYVLLGGWGGYIIGGFDHDVVNNNEYDFAVYSQPSIGNEPAVVYVMQDVNANGQPDDIWYELSGSDTDSDYSAGESYDNGSSIYTIEADPLNKYIRDYELTYNKADLTLESTDSAYGNVTWSDNQGNTGILKSMYYTATSEHWWWPYYGSGVDSKTFKGVKLPHNKFTPDDSLWMDYNDRLQWGYAENYEEDSKSVTFGDSFRVANCFDISNAVDEEGNPVILDQIRFIKVQTGVFLQAGWLNEISSDISGAVDLNSEWITVN